MPRVAHPTRESNGIDSIGRVAFDSMYYLARRVGQEAFQIFSATVLQFDLIRSSCTLTV